MFRKLLGCLVIVFLGLLLVACDGDYTIPTENVNNVSIFELIQNPTNYKDVRVTVEGKVIESLGEKSWFTSIPYLGFDGTVKMSLSETEVQCFRFGDDSNSIIIQEETKGAYLPLPIVFAGSTDLPEGTLRITGSWKTDQNGDYYLQIAEVQIINQSG